MKRRLFSSKWRSPHLALLLAISLTAGCIENPFGGKNDISSGTRSMSGTVQLSDRSSPADTYVWLENFNLGVRAGTSGQFALILPPPAAQGGNGATGIFNLYFYMANYELTTAKVATRNGAFIYSEADLNKKGELTATKSLKKFLSINTTLTPATISANSTQLLDIQITLQTINDTVTVVIPESPGTGNLIGALLIRDLNKSDIYLYKTTPLGNIREIVQLHGPPHVRQAALSLLTLPLPPGDYEVIPYLLIRHQDLPPGLSATLGNGLETLSANYLQIPMRREGGKLHVTQ